MKISNNIFNFIGNENMAWVIDYNYVGDKCVSWFGS